MNYHDILDDDMTYAEMTELLTRLESILWSRKNNMARMKGWTDKASEMCDTVYDLWAHVNSAWKCAEDLVASLTDPISHDSTITD